MVLAICLQHPEHLWDIMDQVRPEDFANWGHQQIYRILLDLIGERDPLSIGAPLVIASLEAEGILDQVGGFAYLQTLSQVDVPPADIGVYVQQVLDAATRRQLAEVLEESQRQIRDMGNFEASQIIAWLTQRVSAVEHRQAGHDGVAQIGDALEATLAEVRETTNGLLGLSSGFPLLDQETLGWEGGKLYAVAATAKAGKSMLLLNWAAEAAMTQGVPTLWLDTEMTLREEQWRLLARTARVPERALKTGQYRRDPRAVQRVQEAVKLIKSAPLYHRYVPNFDIQQLASLVRRYKSQKGIGLVVFDYLKIPSSDDGRRESWQILGTMTTLLKDLAGELQIPIITAAQLQRGANRATELDESLIGGSFQIVQYVNMLMFLRKKTPKEIEEAGWHRGNMVLTIGPSRQGGNYEGLLRARRDISYFEELDNVALPEPTSEWDADAS